MLALAGLAALMGQSLGDAARAIRMKKAQAPKAPETRVYTNENLPHGTNISVIGGVEPPAPGAKGATGATGAMGATGATGATDAKADEEKTWKDKFAKLRQTQSEEERRLDLLQRELNMAQVQAYSDPNQANREAFTRNELNTRTADIEKQKLAVEAAKKAITTAEDELRKAGLPSGWAQP
jgi:hypothetical protein